MHKKKATVIVKDMKYFAENQSLIQLNGWKLIELFVIDDSGKIHQLLFWC